MGVDIEQELQTIRNQPGGDTVKVAICSALNKIAQTRGGDVIKEFDKGVTFDAPVGAFGLEEIGAVSDIYDNPTLVLTVTETRSTQNYGTIDEIYFYDENQNRIAPSISEVTANVRPYTDFESEGKCVDGNISTKWLWYWNNPTILTIVLTDDFHPAYMSYVTGNDFPERDPISFSIDFRYRSLRKTFLTVSNATITTSRQTETQKFECDWD